MVGVFVCVWVFVQFYKRSCSFILVFCCEDSFKSSQNSQKGIVGNELKD